MFRRTTFQIGFLAVIFLAGMGLSWYLTSRKQADPIEESTILLEKIRKVCKLVTVEGHFIEYYDYEEATPSGPWYLLGPVNWAAGYFKKSARIRVKAKVLVGYDLGDIQIQALPEENLIRISNLPQPSILSIEHEIDYFDSEAYLFRPITDAEIKLITNNAVGKIREAAESSQLIQAAEQQGSELFDLIEFMVVNAGWSLEIQGRPLPGHPEQLDSAGKYDQLWEDL